MGYYFSKILNTDFDDALNEVAEGLKKIGFGIVTEINIQQVFKNKLNIDCPPHKILGACSPVQANKIIKVEPEAATMLPCNITVRQIGDRQIQVTAVDAKASLASIKNPDIDKITEEVSDLMRQMLAQL